MPSDTITTAPLKALLDAEGRSQRWLAAASDINPSTLSRIVHDQRDPTLSEARRIANALQRSVADIWGADGARPGSPVDDA